MLWSWRVIRPWAAAGIAAGSAALCACELLFPTDSTLQDAGTDASPDAGAAPPCSVRWSATIPNARFARGLAVLPAPGGVVVTAVDAPDNFGGGTSGTGVDGSVTGEVFEYPRDGGSPSTHLVPAGFAPIGVATDVKSVVYVGLASRTSRDELVERLDDGGFYTGNFDGSIDNFRVVSDVVVGQGAQLAWINSRPNRGTVNPTLQGGFFYSNGVAVTNLPSRPWDAPWSLATDQSGYFYVADKQGQLTLFDAQAPGVAVDAGFVDLVAVNAVASTYGWVEGAPSSARDVVVLNGSNTIFQGPDTTTADAGKTDIVGFAIGKLTVGVELSTGQTLNGTGGPAGAFSIVNVGGGIHCTMATNEGIAPNTQGARLGLGKTVAFDGSNAFFVITDHTLYYVGE